MKKFNNTKKNLTIQKKFKKQIKLKNKNKE